MGRAVAAAVVIATGVMCLGVGFVLGWFTSSRAVGVATESVDARTEERSRMLLMEEIKAENIEEKVRFEQI